MCCFVLPGNVVNGTIGKQMVDMLVESSNNVEMILKFFDMFLKLKDLTSSDGFKEYDPDGKGKALKTCGQKNCVRGGLKLCSLNQLLIPRTSALGDPCSATLCHCNCHFVADLLWLPLYIITTYSRSRNQAWEEISDTDLSKW